MRWLPRIAARLRAARLDRALIGGADPGTSAQVAARAAQLTTDCTRAEIAEELDRLADAARQRQSSWRVRPARTAVLANEPELHTLAKRLREPGPVYAQGIAILHELLADGTGPVYTDHRGVALAEALHDAGAALSGRTTRSSAKTAR